MKTRRPWYKRWWAVTLAALLITVTIFFAWLVGDVVSDLETAREACREKITDRAKYESGVKFIEDTESETTQSTKYGGLDYKVIGEVDLVNGFGAPVRHTYWCHVGANDGETGNPEITLEEK